MQDVALSEAEPVETRFVEMVLPGHANHYGTLLGGTALSLMGKGGVRRSRPARPLQCGDGCAPTGSRLTSLCGWVSRTNSAASVARVGGSAMTVAVDMIREDLMSRPSQGGGARHVRNGRCQRRRPADPHSETQHDVSQADKEMAS